MKGGRTLRNAVILGGVLFSAGCAGQGSKPADPADEAVASRLVGTWSLAHYEARVGDQPPTLPFGPRATGRLMYDASGNMSVQLLDPDRPLFASPDWTAGTPSEIETAFERFVGYYGDYALDEAAGTVTHHIRGAHYPNWVGTDQVRTFRLAGDTLVLSTPPFFGRGVEAVHTLWWVKVR